jgi:SNF2 family DNA or RNA helicase
MKEDVEDLPEKEEVVIWVELTPEQRRWASHVLHSASSLLSIAAGMQEGGESRVHGWCIE